MLRLTRIWLPVAIGIAGIALIVVGHARVSPHADTHSIEAGTGVVLLGVALMVWMVNWMFQMSVTSNRDREREEDARRYFDEHGRWPDE